MVKKNRSARLGRRESRRRAHRRDQRLRLLRYGSLGLLAAIVLGAFSIYRTSNAPDVDTPTGIMAANLDGPQGAPVQIVEFGDFGCPSCRAWHKSGIKQALMARFGEQLSFTFRHFPVITLQSPLAAEASQCAAEQNQFWEYHDHIYELATFGELAREDLKRYARVIGLNSDQFDRCLESGKYRSYVDRDRQAAAAAGARGTPTFYINGQPAPFSFEGMAAIIEQELNS